MKGPRCRPHPRARQPSPGPSAPPPHLLHARRARVQVHHQQQGHMDVFAAEEPGSCEGTETGRVSDRRRAGQGRAGPGGRAARSLPLCRAASSSRSLSVCTSVSRRFLSWTFCSRTTSFLRASSSLAAAASPSLGPALAMADPLPLCGERLTPSAGQHGPRGRGLSCAGPSRRCAALPQPPARPASPGRFQSPFPLPPAPPAPAAATDQPSQAGGRAPRHHP